LGLVLGFCLILAYSIIEEATEDFTEKLTWNGIFNEFSAFPLGFLAICIIILGFLYVALYILEDII
jgi:hypothetical protein